MDDKALRRPTQKSGIKRLGSVPATTRENGLMPKLVNTGLQLQLHDLAGNETIKMGTIDTPQRWHV